MKRKYQVTNTTVKKKKRKKNMHIHTNKLESKQEHVSQKTYLALRKWVQLEYRGMKSTTGADAVTIHRFERPQSKYGWDITTGSDS
jgi:hypothetical protein